jgi:starch synthase
MNILFVTSEVHPFSKTGGLADVTGALPLALARMGHQVMVISPWYDTLKGDPWLAGELQLPWGERARIGETILDGVRFVFTGWNQFNRPDYYGYWDDVERFARFCAHVPHTANVLGFRPDVVHLHDWQTGLVAPILRTTWLPDPWWHVPIIYTIHNLAYQGRWGAGGVIYWTGLPWSVVHNDGLEYYGDANCMKAGINFSDVVTTVSPTYARDVQTPEGGFGLDGVLRRKGVLGILNGLDADYWNPATDPLIPHRYSEVSGKAPNRAALVQELGLDGSRPLLAMVTRLTDQKGLDIVMAGLSHIADDWNLVVLGSGDQRYQGPLEAIAHLEPSRVAFRGGFNEALAHRIYAGSDAFLMPSAFEPCGLSQMIAMRYGTVPIVRRTGGLADTVPDARGYGFEAYNAHAMLDILHAARQDWGSSTWDAKVRAGMTHDFSWDSPAHAYVDLYERLTHR